MATIFYSMAGEGRGHASRAYTIIEHLKEKHTIFVFAPEHAFDLLSPIYLNTEVTVKRIPGLLFKYNDRQEVDLFKSFSKSLEYIFNSDRPLKELYSYFEKYTPDLVITDFEWMLPKAAEKYNVPYISIDHQHFLSYYDLKNLPLDLRGKAAFMSPALNLFYMNHAAAVVSAFYFPELKKNLGNTVYQTGVFINDNIRYADSEDRKYILVYLRRFLSKEIMYSLESSCQKVIVYTDQNLENYKNIQFKKLSKTGFTEDLAKCAMLVTTAGNQLVGEALYLKKPVIVMPEPNNFEQEINGFFLEQSCGGINVLRDDFEEDTIKNFYDKRYIFKCHTPQKKICGNEYAESIINHYIKNAHLYKKEKFNLRMLLNGGNI